MSSAQIIVETEFVGLSGKLFLEWLGYLWCVDDRSHHILLPPDLQLFPKCQARMQDVQDLNCFFLLVGMIALSEFMNVNYTHFSST